MIELKRFVNPINSHELVTALKEPHRFETELLGLDADFDNMWSVFTELSGSEKSHNSMKERAQWDRTLAVELHKSLHHISRRQAADMRFWQWLCIVEMQTIVWFRWCGNVPEDYSSAMSSSLAERFLGAPTLRGVSRNSLARLWWCAETLSSDDHGYSMVDLALKHQDFFQAVFERKMGLYPPVAKACIRALGNSSEDERRQATKKLNHCFTTIAAEALQEKDIIDKFLCQYQH